MQESDENNDAWLITAISFIGKSICILLVSAACVFILYSVATNPVPYPHWTIRESIFGVSFFVAASFVYLWIFFRMASARTEALSATYAIGFAIVSMTMIILYFACMYADHGMIDMEKNVIHDMPSALYFSVVTFTTLGFGDIIPTKESRLFVCIQAIMGLLYVGLLISMFVAIFTRRVSTK